MTRVVLAALLVAACRDQAPPTETQSVTVGVPRPTEPPRQESVVLLDAGAEPRTQLRYAVLPDAVQHLHLETTAKGRELAGGAWTEPQELPVMRTGFEIRATEGGALHITALDGPTDSAWTLLAGRSFTLLGDDRARYGGLAFADDGPTGRAILDEAAQRVLALRVPVPDEAIGTGASWRVVTLLRQRPALVKQTATYRVRGRDGARWTIDVELTRIAEPQRAEDPGVPEGTNVDVVALVLRLSGTLVIDRSQPFPTGDLSSRSTLHLSIRSGSGTTEQLYEDESRILVR